MNFWTALFLGIIQGLTEFLPVSSSGHLSIFENIFKLKYSEEDNVLFEVMLHLGTLAAVFMVYRKDIIPMVRDTWNFLTKKGNGGKSEDGRVLLPVRMMLLVVVGTLPLFVMVFLNGVFESLFANTSFVAFALLITGTVLYAAQKIPAGKKTERSITGVDAVCIGLAQAVALLPGISRSGATMSAGFARGLKKEFAVRFSFLLSVPAILGSFLIEIVKCFSAGVTWSYLPLYIIGMIVAGAVGYFALSFLKSLIEKAKMVYFSYYCWGIGTIVLIISMFL